MTRKDRNVPDFHRPHVVILGAGATRAAIPKGDKHGRLAPVMADLIETLGLESLISKAELPTNGYFETLYTEIASRSELSSVREELEIRVFDYFAALELPDAPTIYDHLVLAMRPKDFILTFNWDPLLLQAIQRCYENSGFKPPNVCFLHGCTAIGYCDRHQPLLCAPVESRCRRCGSALKRSSLLFPVAEKDYTSDAQISTSWKDAQTALASAFILTIFGYSAPASDAAAIKLLHEGWGDSVGRSLEETEIVNLVPESELLSSWESFIFHPNHAETMTSLWSSWLLRHPRRSCDSCWSAVMDLSPRPENPPPRDTSVHDLRQWYSQLAVAESSEY